MPGPENDPSEESDRYQDLLARESQITWERARVGDSVPLHHHLPLCLTCRIMPIMAYYRYGCLRPAALLGRLNAG
jgi:hypothetical protein